MKTIGFGLFAPNIGFLLDFGLRVRRRGYGSRRARSWGVSSCLDGAQPCDGTIFYEGAISGQKTQFCDFQGQYFSPNGVRAALQLQITA